jgi:hypothetical protein
MAYPDEPSGWLAAELMAYLDERSGWPAAGDELMAYSDDVFGLVGWPAVVR